MNRFQPLLLALMATATMTAKVIPGSPFGDGMVLQQQTQVRLWGWAKANAEVRITPSWNRQTVRVKTGSDGRWDTKITTPAASFTPQTLRLTDGDVLTLRNVLIGEVWLSSGQSNMEMPLNGFTNCPVEGSNATIAEAGRYRGQFHFLTVPKEAARTPQDSIAIHWEECTPATARLFSAAAYYFATNLINVLQCPVGVINCSWGGSRVEGWLPEDVLRTYPDIDLSDATFNDVGYMTPLIMYNAMLHPLEGYTVKGFLWYQGESNVGHADTYADRFATMIKRWRKDWGQGDLPFYYVELAPFDHGGNESGAFLREAQCKVHHMLPNTGMVCTNDLAKDYEVHQVHACRKREVGERLSYLALRLTYGIKGIEAESPEFASMEVQNGKAVLAFTHAEGGFNRMTGIQGFEVCGSDGIFHAAQAVVNGIRIVVSSSEVAEPVAVRYAFRNFLPGNLSNLAGLPVVPFRTDK